MYPSHVLLEVPHFFHPLGLSRTRSPRTFTSCHLLFLLDLPLVAPNRTASPFFKSLSPYTKLCTPNVTSLDSDPLGTLHSSGHVSFF